MFTIKLKSCTVQSFEHSKVVVKIAVVNNAQMITQNIFGQNWSESDVVVTMILCELKL